MTITTHRYVNNYLCKETDKALILGTIHPHQINNFQIDFFYGNRNSIWKILDEAFPNKDFSSRESIIDNLQASNIWISDMISSCERENDSITQDKLLRRIRLNTKQIEDGLMNSKIKEIFFTSGFGKNNAAKLFCEAFEIKPFIDENRAFIIPKSNFNREIQCKILFSPSGQANIGISKNKKYLSLKDKYQNYTNPVKQFKIDSYKSAFNNYFNA
jgi:G:T/U-mismatch repair DNA glycosylase